MVDLFKTGSMRVFSQEDDTEKNTKHQNPSDQPTIDCYHLIELLGDEDLINKVMSIFLKETKEHIQVLNKSLKNSDAEAICCCAHVIKSSASNVGATHLSRIAYKLESIAKENNSKQVTSLLDNLQCEFERVAAILSKSNWLEIVKQQKQCTKNKLDEDVEVLLVEEQVD